MVTLIRESHQENALSPMEVTESGMVTLIRESHRENALSPMEVTESGMVTLVRESHQENAQSPMAVTFFPSSISEIARRSSFPLYLVITTVTSSSSAYS